MDHQRQRKRRAREDLNAETHDLDAYLNDLRGAISRVEGMLMQLHEHEATVVKVINDKIGMLKPMQDKYTDLLAKVSALMEQEEELKSKICRVFPGNFVGQVALMLGFDPAQLHRFEFMEDANAVVLEQKDIWLQAFATWPGFFHDPLRALPRPHVLVRELATKDTPWSLCVFGKNDELAENLLRLGCKVDRLLRRNVLGILRLVALNACMKRLLNFTMRIGSVRVESARSFDNFWPACSVSWPRLGQRLCRGACIGGPSWNRSRGAMPLWP